MEYIESIIQILQFPGKIRMKNPSLQFSLVFDYGHIGESIMIGGIVLSYIWLMIFNSCSSNILWCVNCIRST